MKAMCLDRLGPLAELPGPLSRRDLPDPVPRAGEVLVRVAVCGVCHTELDEIEGRTPPPRLPVVPGHQVVGRVAALGDRVTDLAVGDRVGVGWIWQSSGAADENLSPKFLATGRDVNGGYAELMTVPAAYAVPLPAVFRDAEAAPLLCAGAVGYRALRLCELNDGEPLGLTGFGASAHLVLQLARHRYPNSRIHVFARDRGQREFARELGAAWAGDTRERAPEQLAAIIDTTPAWQPVVEALANLRPGGRLVINAIRKQDDDKDALLGLSYREHLWLEREVKSVANVTVADLRDCLALAAEARLRPEVTTFPLAAANAALHELARGGGRGAKVLQIG
ncbi:MAG: alcohol dehydrogenase catalytic domain-containing protein [Planctomycetes bacterium]|nr:alcohol dehydrogenase catalytic domain-containing protein [Planctomycetota bacterium]